MLKTENAVRCDRGEVVSRAASKVALACYQPGLDVRAHELSLISSPCNHLRCFRVLVLYTCDMCQAPEVRVGDTGILSQKDADGDMAGSRCAPRKSCDHTIMPLELQLIWHAVVA